MLGQNQEEQRVLKKGLSESKKCILQVQKDIGRAEEKGGQEGLQIDVDALLRTREVWLRRRGDIRPEDKEGREGFWS